MCLVLIRRCFLLYTCEQSGKCLPIQLPISSSIGIVEFCIFSCGNNVAEYPDVMPAAIVATTGPAVAKH